VLKIRNGRLAAKIAGVVVAGGGLAVAVAGMGAAATQYTVPLHQATPITAAGFGSHEADCGSIPSTQDGWHFVLPGNFTVFVSLTVTFSPGGTQTITSFGPPSDKHAFAGSAPGATLESASATVQTQDGQTQVLWFNLSHTCPANSPTPTPSPTPTTTPSPSPSPSGTSTGTPTPSAPGPSPSPTTPAAPAPTPTPVQSTLPVTG
jgi:hypothetical protein